MTSADIITSRTNTQVKRWRELASDARARRIESLVWVEGEHLLQEAVRAGWVIDTLIMREGAAHADWQALHRVRVSAPVMSAVSQLESPAACAALLKVPNAADPLLICEDALIIDGVQDPGNIGTMLRCAWAFGVKRALLTTGSASAWSLKALRAGQGAQFHMQIDEAVDEAAIAGLLRVPLIATVLAQSALLPALDLRKPVAWVFGHEGQGVSPHLLAMAQHRARIPMPGMAESLNVGAACAVCLYEAMRQRS
jgi:RNA methyltransferase, TrmH family